MKNQPIRIIQYIGSLDSGGSQSMIMNIYRNIDRKKIQFDFIVDRKQQLLYKKEIESLGGKVYIFEEYFHGINYFSYRKQWIEFFKNHLEYRIIHCHVRSVASIVLRIAKSNNLVTICHSHSTSNGSGIKSKVKKILQSRIKEYCDYFFACSKKSAIWLYGKKIAESDKCFIINNAIDSKKFIYNEKTRNNVRKKFNLEDKIVLGQVGRIETVKNYNFTIDVLKELVRISDNYYLLIIGNGSLKQSIIDKVQVYNLSKNVIFLENRNDVNELLQAIDIFLMPSLWEGLPLSLVEAQAASLPCIISDKVIDGILNNDIVYKVNIDDKKKWVSIIEKITEQNTLRQNQQRIIVNSGFDIIRNTIFISNFYLNIQNSLNNEKEHTI